MRQAPEPVQIVKQRRDAALQALLGGGRAESEGTFDGAVLEMTWKHGPCSGTARYEFDAQCERATGRAIGTRGGFGTCRGIDVSITLERAAR